ncbi:MAG TPA: hypothetical protein PLL30_01585 [Candidatus Krumholzibacteria bacterium]|nr:hypothetical protein [Candidatus Krumholzibacteria bacterium]HPD70456.1 hypothetical protein [Candidatus Krumholzibacteria bacterium]HRY39844.1 hypothetical protein [Candidatus Krumholzibacteria bacterium]
MDRSLVRRRPLVVVGLVLFLAVWLKNAWVCDDAYINFRSLEQLRAGHGPIWNPHERVQVYTSVLWYWLQAPLRLVSPDVYLNVLALSLACSLGLLAVTRRLVPNPTAWLCLIGLMVGAGGFMDFTSSGLENPLLLVATAVLCDRYLAAMALSAGDPGAAAAVRRLLVAAGWSLLVRHDLVVFWLPPAAQAIWRHRRAAGVRTWLRWLAIAAAPLAAWSAFAVFYYGSPWPNAALAKLALGVPVRELLPQGLRYLGATLRDPVLPVVIVAGTIAALARPATIALALGASLHVAYLVRAGGDFMQGRMLGAVFLVMAVVLARALADRGPQLRRAAAAAAFVTAVLLPRTPLNTGSGLDQQDFPDGIADERAYYFQATSLWVRLRTPAGEFPPHEWARDGRRERNRDAPVVGSPNVGFFGYLAGVDKIVVDRYAIADPFLSRIPVGTLADDWRPGHVRRPAPPGYAASLRYEANDLKDPALQALYEDVRLATSAPLLARGRAGAIWRLTTGAHGRRGGMVDPP